MISALPFPPHAQAKGPARWHARLPRALPGERSASCSEACLSSGTVRICIRTRCSVKKVSCSFYVVSKRLSLALLHCICSCSPVASSTRSPCLPRLVLEKTCERAICEIVMFTLMLLLFLQAQSTCFPSTKMYLVRTGHEWTLLPHLKFGSRSSSTWNLH